jgi:hypothetical protein
LSVPYSAGNPKFAGTRNSVDEARYRCSFARLGAGVVGLLLATKLYVLQEIFAGLLSLAILFGMGVVVLVVFVLLREVWLYGGK